MRLHLSLVVLAFSTFSLAVPLSLNPRQTTSNNSTPSAELHVDLLDSDGTLYRSAPHYSCTAYPVLYSSSSGSPSFPVKLELVKGYSARKPPSVESLELVTVLEAAWNGASPYFLNLDRFKKEMKGGRKYAVRLTDATGAMAVTTSRRVEDKDYWGGAGRCTELSRPPLATFYDFLLYFGLSLSLISLVLLAIIKCTRSKEHENGAGMELR
ncbi:hypothetical protein JCM8097_000027 [Rhodosporidiobolus ruineniae]